MRTHTEQAGDAAGDKRRAMSIMRTARALDVSRTTVWRLVKSGQLKTVSIGRRRLVAVTSIDELMNGAA